MLVGATIEVPALAAGVWLLAQRGLGDPDVPFMRIVRITAIFAGIAAILTAAGLGRLAAYASVEGGRPRAAWVAGRAHAVASIGLLVIAVIPHGHIPERSWLWLWYPVTGLAVGAVCGAVIGVVCGGAAPVGIGDVLDLAYRPTKAIGRLLAPEDLVKLGVALRDRTSNLFEGMFEPAAPRGAPDAGSPTTTTPPTTTPPPTPAPAPATTTPDAGAATTSTPDTDVAPVETVSEAPRSGEPVPAATTPGDPPPRGDAT